MRVRGWWPFVGDRPISLPIEWQTWMLDDPHPSDGPLSDEMSRLSLTTAAESPARGSQEPPGRSFSGNSQETIPRTITLTDPFANPVELAALKASFIQQPNWRAAMLEGESWDGTAEENIARWQNLLSAHHG